MAIARVAPRISRALNTDVLTVAILAGFVLTWGLYFLVDGAYLVPPWRSASDEGVTGSGLWKVAVAVTVLLLPLLAYRIHMFMSAFESGQLYRGRITDIEFFRNRGRVSFTYEVDGKEISVVAPVMKNARSKALLVGQEVDVVVHPVNPGRAFVLDLYR